MVTNASELQLNDLDRKALEANLSTGKVDSEYAVKDMIDFTVDIVCSETAKNVAYAVCDDMTDCSFSS